MSAKTNVEVAGILLAKAKRNRNLRWITFSVCAAIAIVLVALFKIPGLMFAFFVMLVAGLGCIASLDFGESVSDARIRLVRAEAAHQEEQNRWANNLLKEYK